MLALKMNETDSIDNVKTENTFRMKNIIIDEYLKQCLQILKIKWLSVIPLHKNYEMLFLLAKLKKKHLY